MQPPLTPRLRIVLASAGILALIGIAPRALAYTVTTGGVTAGDGSGLTTAVGSATVLTFNSLAAPTVGTVTTDGVTLSGSGGVVSGSLPGSTAAPSGDSTNFLATTGSETLTTTSTSNNYLGLDWGSVASANTVSVLSGGATVATISGGDVAAASGTTNYVNIYDLPSYDTVILSTTSSSFAADNIAIGTVPEPGTLALLGAGLLGLGIIRRRSGPRLVSIRPGTPVFPR
jgi:hypothetical protein